MKPSIEEQIAAARAAMEAEICRVYTPFDDPRAYGRASSGRGIWATVLATLSQHKRAMAVVDAARGMLQRERYIIGLDPDGPSYGPGNAIADALAALDTAETEQGR